MNNKIVERYLDNFSLINTAGMEVFAKEQSKLLSVSLVGCTTDYRGTLTYHGIDGFFQGLAEWSEHFVSNHQSDKTFLEDSSSRVVIRVHNTIGLAIPVDGKAISNEGDHDWTEEFDVSPDGLITKIHIKVLLKQHS